MAEKLPLFVGYWGDDTGLRTPGCLLARAEDRVP